MDDKVDDLTVLSSTLQSLPVLIAWGRCVRFVEFPDLFTPDHCLREAGAGDSNPLTPTKYFNKLQYIKVPRHPWGGVLSGGHDAKTLSRAMS